MGISTAITNLYQPVQPAVTQQDGPVAYNEWLPDSRLQPFIYCYWQLKTTEQLTDAYQYRVVADGCMDIYFDLNNPVENYVMGFCEAFTEFPLDACFNYVGVRFLPTMFPQLFGINAMELSNRSVELTSVVPALSRYITTHINNSLQQPEIRQLLDNYFIHQLARVAFDHDSRLYEAMAVMLSHNGCVNVDRNLNTGISPRQLRRLFAFYVGGTAKTFCRIVRFQHMLKAGLHRQRLQQEKLFYDVGYCDQSHFIKEFKNLYGTTPGKAFVL